MRIRLQDRTLVGQALDLRDMPISASRVLEAIREPADPLLDAGPPRSLHREIGHVYEGMELDRRASAVAAARSCGLVPPQDVEIATVEDRIAAVAPGHPNLRTARQRVAETGQSVAALRERVARLSGRVEAVRENGGDASESVAALQDATRNLSEAETEAIAAEQALATAEASARSARDTRAERLSLVDRRENLRRQAREWLVTRLEPRLERAIASLPIPPLTTGSPLEYRGSDAQFALALARIGAGVAPLVLETHPFDRAVRARAALDTPVVLV